GVLDSALTTSFIKTFFDMLLGFLETLLGILTLLSGLNIYLAATHQIASLILVSSVILLIYKLKS
ncbi:MAG: hypothetical protein EBW08_04015, partial [Pelagibacteraceae bacterium]|nr:hypothetical protein [Pelagibacteraceae bacterium]